MEHHYSSKLAWSLVLAFAMAAAATSPCAAQSTSAEFVSLHNSSRALVSVGPVTWDAAAAAYAQTYANQRKADCYLVPSGGTTYGENIFRGSPASTWTASSAVNAWTSEKLYYDYATNTCASGKICGHYTQVVWSSSTSIGCAGVICDSNRGVFIICSYNPAGNIAGQKPY